MTEIIWILAVTLEPNQQSNQQVIEESVCIIEVFVTRGSTEIKYFLPEVRHGILSVSSFVS